MFFVKFFMAKEFAEKKYIIHFIEFFFFSTGIRKPIKVG